MNGGPSLLLCIAGTTFYINKYLFNLHCVSNKLVYRSAAVVEASKKMKALQELLLIISIKIEHLHLLQK